MSLLDKLGSSQSNNTEVTSSHKMNNLKYVASLLQGRNINPKNLALNMINQNSNLNGQLKQFLASNGVSDDQLKQLGINI